MAKVKSGSSSTGSTRAGKKHLFIEPPAKSLEKERAREMGKQQFVAKEFPRPLPAQKGTWEAACDTMCAAFGVKRIRTRQDDNGMRFCESRQQFVMPPAKEAVGKK